MMCMVLIWMMREVYHVNMCVMWMVYDVDMSVMRDVVWC